jgi:hypothetical protein
MNAHDLADRICKDIVRGVFERGGRTFIVTRFTYPVGDSVNLYVAEAGGSTRISDLGTTHYVLRIGGIDITETREKFIRSVCALYGVDFEGGTVLSKRINPDAPGEDVLSFCEAVTRISTMEFEAGSRRTSHLGDQVESLIAARVDPTRRGIRNWTEATHDPEKAHTIDYRFNTVGDPRNLFVVTSDKKAEAVAGIVHFWERYYATAKSLSVIDPDVALAAKTYQRLRRASEILEHGLDGNNDEYIVRFALSGMPAGPTA